MARTAAEVAAAMVTLEPSALNSSVLVLNQHYAAVRVVSARRAFCLLFKQIAEIIALEDQRYQSYDFESWKELSEFRARYERDHHEWVRCVKFELAVPRIVRLLFCDRYPQRPVKLNRRNIYARDRNRCQYCGRKFSTTELSIDHVVPRSRGGNTTWDNVVCCCVRCNVRKGGRLPAEAGLRLVVEPVRPRHSPVVTLRLTSEKYQSWKQFLDTAYWNVELRD